MATVIIEPPAMAGVFNTVLLRLYKEPDDPETVSITITGNGKSIILSRDWFTDLIEFNLSHALSGTFSDEQINIPYIPNTFVDKRLYFTYTVEGTGEYLNYMAFNAVSQQRGPFDVSSFQGKFLTEKTTLKKYPGYPLDVSFMGFQGGTYVLVNGVPQNTEKVVTYHLTLQVWEGTNMLQLLYSLTQLTNITTNSNTNITTNKGDIITTNADNGILPGSFLKVEETCLPKSPVYVRWINKIAGFDYWMFENRHFIKKEFEAKQTFYSEQWDIIPGLPMSDKVISAEATEVLTIGSEGLSELDFSVVSALPFSPLIQIFDVQHDDWITVRSDKIKVEKNTGETKHAVEFELVMPRINLQF